MKILAIRADKPEAELYLYSNGQLLSKVKWQAHLKLAETLNAKIDGILNRSSSTTPRNKFRGDPDNIYDQLDGIAIYKGPGSFTGLRVSMSVANALAYAQAIPIVAKSGENWLMESVDGLMAGQNDRTALPEYGAPVHTTPPRRQLLSE